MNELTDAHTKFLKRKVLPMLENLNKDDTITFDDFGYTTEEAKEWINSIMEKGEYDKNEKRFLTGISKLYEHINGK